MTFRIADAMLCNYSKVYEVEVVERYLNGFKVRFDNGDIGYVPKSDIKIYDISEEEAHMPIRF